MSANKAAIMVNLPVDLIDWLDKEIVGRPDYTRENGRHGMSFGPESGIKRRSRSTVIEHIIREWAPGALEREKERLEKEAA